MRVWVLLIGRLFEDKAVLDFTHLKIQIYPGDGARAARLLLGMLAIFPRSGHLTEHSFIVTIRCVRSYRT